MKTLNFTVNNIEETQALATRLAANMKGGEILFLSGPIGAGKTVMVSAIAAAFGFKKRPVSASFSIMKKYQNKKFTIYHIDLFRLSEGEMFNLGFEELLQDEKALILAEWPAPAQDFFPQDRLEITVNLLEGARRMIELKACGRKSAELLKNL